MTKFQDEFQDAIAMSRKRKEEEFHKKQTMVEDKYEGIIKKKLIAAASKGYSSTYFRMTRSDFAGWHNLVEGGYEMANPVDLALAMMKYLKEIGSIPKNVKFQFINKQKFIILFTWVADY